MAVTGRGLNLNRCTRATNPEKTRRGNMDLGGGGGGGKIQVGPWDLF